jgi:hypothetical protein
MSEEQKTEQAPKVVTLSEDPSEMAATMLYMYTPKFYAAVDKLSSNALRRVLKKLVSYPLNDKEFKATSTGEAEVFTVGDRLLEAKFLMIMAEYEKMARSHMEQQAKQEEGKE